MRGATSTTWNYADDSCYFNSCVCWSSKAGLYACRICLAAPPPLADCTSVNDFDLFSGAGKSRPQRESRKDGKSREWSGRLTVINSKQWAIIYINRWGVFTRLMRSEGASLSASFCSLHQMLQFCGLSMSLFFSKERCHRCIQIKSGIKSPFADICL